MTNFQKRPQGAHPGGAERALAAVGLAAGAITATLLYYKRHSAPAAAHEEVADPLATYVHDHLAGAVGAIDMLERLRDDHDGDRLSRFAGDLLAEIEQDRSVLRELAEKIGGDQDLVKESGAWLASKTSELKIGRDAAGNFGSFQALEMLALGIQGKLALWQTFAAIGDQDRRLDGFDFRKLARRAESQHRAVERWRMVLAQSVFGAR